MAEPVLDEAFNPEKVFKKSPNRHQGRKKSMTIRQLELLLEAYCMMSKEACRNLSCRRIVMLFFPPPVMVRQLFLLGQAGCVIPFWKREDKAKKMLGAEF